MDSYPQLFHLDYEGKGRRLTFRQNPKGIDELIEDIKNDGAKKDIDFLSGHGYYNPKRIAQRFDEFVKRMGTTMSDDPRFGLILVTMNILFIIFAWYISLKLSNFVFNILDADSPQPIPTEMEMSKSGNSRGTPSPQSKFK